MLDEMRPEQMAEWLAYTMIEHDDKSAGYTDPADQEAVLRAAMGF